MRLESLECNIQAFHQLLIILLIIPCTWLLSLHIGYQGDFVEDQAQNNAGYLPAPSIDSPES